MRRAPFPLQPSGTILGMRRGGGWLLTCATIGLLAGNRSVVRWDVRADAWLAHQVHALTPLLHVVWPLGSPLVASGLAVAATLLAGPDWRRRRFAWVLLAVGGLAELSSKVLGLGRPTAMPAIPVLPVLRLGLRPAFHAIGRPVPAWLAAMVAAVRLRGTYPSGHVMRLALIPGFLFRRRGQAAAFVVALVAGLAVVATGGHSVTDALGGLCLAQALLCFWRASSPPSAVPETSPESPSPRASGTAPK